MAAGSGGMQLYFCVFDTRRKGTTRNSRDGGDSFLLPQTSPLSLSYCSLVFVKQFNNFLILSF
jgi:hypothetical protein